LVAKMSEQETQAQTVTKEVSLPVQKDRIQKHRKKRTLKKRVGHLEVVVASNSVAAGGSAPEVKNWAETVLSSSRIKRAPLRLSKRIRPAKSIVKE